MAPVGRFPGKPMRTKGIRLTPSSAMWGQVGVGWKADYPALRVIAIGSLVAWQPLASSHRQAWVMA